MARCFTHPKGVFFKYQLIRNKHKKWIRIGTKHLTILPDYLDYFFHIYNGKKWVKMKITKAMIGYKFGEFVNTRKRFVYKKKKK